MILDQDFRVLRIHGDVSPYLTLPVGEVTFDAVRLARPPLSSALASILHDARRRGIATRKKGVSLPFDGKRRNCDLEVIPVGRPESRQYLVVFEDASRPGKGSQSGDKNLTRVDQSRPRPRGDRAVAQLQDELAATKQQMNAMVQDLGAANEELQSANEEILSSNEELQSTNEELDTAREELQSTNEELSTVNDELQARNGELSRANSDLLNILANTQIAVVIVSHDGTIRHVTPAAARVLNVMASDVGRPIGHIRPAVQSADLDQIIKDVSESATVVERQVEDAERNTYILRGRPYKDVDNRMDGVVLALFDVSSALETSRKIGEAIIARVNDPILLLDGDRRVRRANRAFCETFRVTPSDTEGRLVFDLGQGQWNIPALRDLLQNVLPERQNFDGFVVEHDFPTIGKKKIILSGERIESEHTGIGVILLVMRDVTNA
jgi:two-component system CheB/CheR fusion protein